MAQLFSGIYSTLQWIAWRFAFYWPSCFNCFVKWLQCFALESMAILWHVQCFAVTAQLSVTCTVCFLRVNSTGFMRHVLCCCWHSCFCSMCSAMLCCKRPVLWHVQCFVSSPTVLGCVQCFVSSPTVLGCVQCFVSSPTVLGCVQRFVSGPTVLCSV